jgi:nitroimidazol reductase NimA-like FMN-containing flavoprotein (pyridoxamine 5'-phosphate oxidase superfamily)
MIPQAGRVTTSAPWLQELDQRECADLLRTGSVGRVVLTDRALPVALPVNYAVDGDSIVFRTASPGTLSAATGGSVVAFEVDELDLESREGWSVLVTGVMREITSVSELLRVEQLRLESWGAAGPSARFVRVPFALLTGRSLRAQAV